MSLMDAIQQIRTVLPWQESPVNLAPSFLCEQVSIITQHSTCCSVFMDLNPPNSSASIIVQNTYRNRLYTGTKDWEQLVFFSSSITFSSSISLYPSPTLSIPLPPSLSLFHSIPLPLSLSIPLSPSLYPSPTLSLSLSLFFQTCFRGNDCQTITNVSWKPVFEDMIFQQLEIVDKNVCFKPVFEEITLRGNDFATIKNIAYHLQNHTFLLYTIFYQGRSSLTFKRYKLICNPISRERLVALG